jgi:hypothetical protein
MTTDQPGPPDPGPRRPRWRLGEIFGDVLGESNPDDADPPTPADRRDDDLRDDEISRDVPPHHGG